MKGIHLEREYPHPVERVWEAIATSRGIAAWLMPNDFEPRVGHRFELRAKKIPGWRGWVECEVLELVPRRRLVYSWKGDEKQRPTRVCWSLEPTTAGTRLVLDHDGFEGFGGRFAKLMMQSGWKGKLLGRTLPEALEVLRTRGTEALAARTF
jgi:uncharacterized protein YndB with AHSA1/START domain